MSRDAYDRARGTIKLAAKLALIGGQQKLLTFQAPWVPHCDTPRKVYRAHTRMRGLRSVEVSMDVPCRKCAKCKRFRQMKWRERALHEIAQANRTWALTLTFSPVHMAGVLTSAKSPAAKHVERRAYADVQRYFKRLRRSADRFRYLAVFERGEVSGRMHYHVLLHEIGRFPVQKVLLENKWPSFVHARLVVGVAGQVSASYITKYATKDLSVPPRASSGYGRFSFQAPAAGSNETRELEKKESPLTQTPRPQEGLQDLTPKKEEAAPKGTGSTTSAVTGSDEDGGNT